MKHETPTQTIAAGSDPRSLPEFSAIREEINKASHPSQPEVNWKLVESLALTIFKSNGVDLHTATYYTLARTRLNGLNGFCEGTELMAAMICHEWDKFWPQGGMARSEMLDWFNTRTGNILRQQLSFIDSDLPLLSRTERALELICDKLQQVELSRRPRVENLLYFVQNTRKRIEPPAKNSEAQAPFRTLVYAPESGPLPAADVIPSLPELPDMKVQVRGVSEVGSSRKRGGYIVSFVAGMGVTAIIAGALWWWRGYPLQQQMVRISDNAQGAAMVWLESPTLSNYAERLQQLPVASPLQSLNTGMQMLRLAEIRWPESLQQQKASRQWNDTLNARAQNSPQLRGWLQTRQNLRSFADLVMRREKEGLTLSYIKNVVWQAERSLGQETPLEALLTQYQDARAQGQNTEEMAKDINTRLDAVLSRWLLLTNTMRPETVAVDEKMGK